jgi:arylsulfatase A-like enzyme
MPAVALIQYIRTAALLGLAVAESRKNLLVIVCDDLRPMMAPFTDRYGVKAPNLEKLADDSMVFNNTYVQQAVCGPSRNSFMTGKRPDSTNVWTFKTSFRAHGIDTTGRNGSDWTSLPEMFKRHGWNTLGVGKVFHPSSPPSNDCVLPHSTNPRRPTDCRSWSTQYNTTAPANITGLGRGAPGGTVKWPHNPGYSDEHPVVTACEGNLCNFTYYATDAQIKFSAAMTNGPEPKTESCIFQPFNSKVPQPHWHPSCCDLPDENATDYWIADAAVKALQTLVAAPAPWALFVGFHKPHPFWDIPQRFQDMYLDTLPLPNHTDAPTDSPDVAYYSCAGLQGRSDVAGVNCDNSTLNPTGCSYITPNASYAASKNLSRITDNPALVRKIRAGYAGGITWVDLQIGKVLDAVDKLGARENTVCITSCSCA